MSEQREIYRTATTTGLPSKKIEVFITGTPGRISSVKTMAVQCGKCPADHVTQLVDESQSFVDMIEELGWARIWLDGVRIWACPKHAK